MDKIKEYFNRIDISNSLLGSMNNPRAVWLRQNGLIEDFDRPYSRVGAGIDCLLTGPQRWSSEFFISEGNKPSGLLGKFVEALPRYINQGDAVSSYEDAYKTAGYKASIENVIKWFWENESAVKYYQDKWLVEEGKELLSKIEYDSIKYAVTVIEENPYIVKYFKPQEGEGNIERIFQLPIYFKIGEEACKALMDEVYIDHDAKTIQPLDLKSTGKTVYEFPVSFYQFGYFRQAAFYLLALQQYLQSRAEWDTKDILSYEILPFKFIVVESKANSNNPALIYECSENDIYTGLYGGYVKSSSSKVKGIYELLEDYKWHRNNNKWLMPREAYENEGKLGLDVFLNQNEF